MTSAVTTAVIQETKANVIDVPVPRCVFIPGLTGPWPQYGAPSKVENLVTANGQHQDELDFDDCVSEAGLEGLPRQHVRATEGNDATAQLLDWDGMRWAPVPASWEYDRAGFDGAFVPNYIREWVRTVPSGKRVTVNMNNQLFADGRFPIDNDAIIEQEYQPFTNPSKFIFAPHSRLSLIWTRPELI